MTDSDIVKKINELRKIRNAVILAHNYVAGEVQDVADFVGDSLELSIKAAATQAPVIVFCGVSFMAETAKLLAPRSTVLLPEVSAGCPMADMASAEAVRNLRKLHPDAVFVAYVNTTAAVKAEVDICCTSANAEKIVAAIPEDKEIVFLPDQNLGGNVMKNLNRKMILFPGYCPTHHRIEPAQLEAMRAQYPNAPIVVHPECPVEVTSLADAALSTGGMLKFVRESGAKQIIIGTESGIIHRLRKENPDKEFIALAPAPRCSNMKKISLTSVLKSLETMQTPVELPQALIERARLPIDRMLEKSK
ncbi:MAG: quinolinate synthase NadA [Lentisphaeria bacterium]|nr:quinolinate synthase NadA [Lentisphaeria bacterium]